MVQLGNHPIPSEQHFLYSGMTWEQFKVLQSLFESPGMRISYCSGDVELLTISDLHGLIAGNLGFLLELYMAELGLDFFGLEDFTIEVEDVASAQADKSYSFEQRRGVPDLAIEVVIKGERQSKLKRYAALGVPEIWFWTDGQIYAYHLVDSAYQVMEKSRWVDDLDLQHLAECATMEHRQDAIKAFRSS
jgi:Uma2 family endonuclease